MTLSMEEGFISEWCVKEGDVIKIDDELCNVENEKETDVLLSSYEGTILKIIADAGDTYPVNTPIAVVGNPGEDYSALLEGIKAVEPKAAEQREVYQPPITRPADNTKNILGDQYRIMPKVRKLIADKGIDIEELIAFCDGRRITEAEIMDFEQKKNG